MALVAAALLPHPKKLAAEPSASGYKKTVAGFAAVKKLLAQTSAELLIIVSPRVHSQPNPYTPTPSDPTAYYALGLDKVQLSIHSHDNPVESRIFASDPAFIAQTKERARPFGLHLDVSPTLAMDEASSTALSVLDLPEPAPKIVSVLLPYLAPKELFEFGRVLGGVAEQDSRPIAIVAVGNLSSRLTKESPAGFDEAGAQFDDLIKTAAKTNDFMPVLSADPQVVERAGEEAARPLAVVAAAVHGSKLKAKLASYEIADGTGHAVLTWA